MKVHTGSWVPALGMILGIAVLMVGVFLNILILTVIGFVVIVSIAMGYKMMEARRDVAVSLDHDGLKVKGPMAKNEIPYRNISSVELRDNFDYGSPYVLFSSPRINSKISVKGSGKIGGIYTNGEFNRYVLAAHLSVDKIIVVHTNDVDNEGYDMKALVFNLNSNESTSAFYAGLERKIKS